MDQLDLAQNLENQARGIAISAIRKANTPERPSRFFCIECDEEIPEKRRQVIPGVQLCINCQRTLEESQ